jgi:hypothetical protein
MMTAEIAIMNKEAVALAADSAITSIKERGSKIFTSANKIFALSRYSPVGIMVYGTANFMGIPWETIIKIYREELRNKKFETLKEYSDNFINFLTKKNELFPKFEQEKHFKEYVFSYFVFIKNNIEDEVKKFITVNKQIEPKEIINITSEIIKSHHSRWQRADNLAGVPENYDKKLIKKYQKFIEEAKKKVFEKLPLTESLSILLTDIAISLFIKFSGEIGLPDLSGIVITGFGEKDVFPSLQSFFLIGIVDDILQYKEHIENSIGFNNMAAIIPFAQREMVYTFMEGVSPDYEKEIEKYFYQVCDEYPKIIIDSIDKLNEKEKTELKGRFIKISKDWLKNYRIRLKKYREMKFVNPVVSVVAMLPKDELAAMAESLISLTSFKRKVTIELETVGGPIDVAVISKGDGFIWIKRKHYFKSELNPQFFIKYKKEIKNARED